MSTGFVIVQFMVISLFSFQIASILALFDPLVVLVRDKTLLWQKLLILQHFDIFFLRESTVCPRSFDPFHIVSLYIKWVETLWIYLQWIRYSLIQYVQEVVTLFI